MVDDKLLARHLVHTNACTRELLLEGRRLQREGGDGTLYEALIAHALVDETILVKAAAKLLNLPTIELEHFVFDDALTGLMSREMASEHEALPLKRQDGMLMLAMVDPLDIMAMDDIATHVGIDIQPVLVGRTDLAGAIEHAYPTLEESSAIDLGLASDEVDAPTDSGDLNQDSWASFFDDAVAVEVDRESASISQEMRDRPSSLEMSLDDLGIEDDAPGVASGTSDILDSFDEPPPEGAGTEGNADDLLDLGEWEVGDANEVPDDDIPKATPDTSGEIDYGATGDLYVQAENPPQGPDDEDDDPVFELNDLVEDDEVIELDDPIDLDEEDDDDPVFVLDEVAEPEPVYDPLFDLESDVEEDEPAAAEPDAAEPDAEAQEESEGDIFEDVFTEVAEEASEDTFEALAEPEPEPKPGLSALSSLRARLASVKRNPLPKPSTRASNPAPSKEDAEAPESTGTPAEELPLEDAAVARDAGGGPEEEEFVLDDPIEIDVEPPSADPAPSTPRTLGRMAVRRIAVKRQGSEIVLPEVIEKNSSKERRKNKPVPVNTTQEVDPDDIMLEEVDAFEEDEGITLSHDELFDPGPISESANQTVEHDDAIDLKLFEDSDAIDPLEVAPTREFDPDDLLIAGSPPTRDVHLDDVFGSIGEGVGAESTNASDDVQNEIEEISRALRQPRTPNANRFSGEFATVESFSRETTANEALTRDRIAQMNMARKANSSRITTSSPALLNLPGHISEGQLLRALITLMIDRHYITKDELVEMAEALPDEGD